MRNFIINRLASYCWSIGRKASKRLKLSMAEANTEASSEESTLVREGHAFVKLPNGVFYNPVQEFNRDLTIAVISQHAKDHFENLQNPQKLTKTARREAKKNKQSKENDNKNGDASMEIDSDADNTETQNFIAINENKESSENSAADSENDQSDFKCEVGKCHKEGLRVLEALAASGLRSVRFALEIAGLKEVVANDFDQNAVDLIRENVASNEVGHLVRESCSDATVLLCQSRAYDKRFNVIDLDPYGSPALFLDGSLQAVADGGLLCVTCTDTAILCGNAPEKCHASYGAMPLKGKFCHEMALRIVLQTIESHANRHSRYIQPLLSISADFYVRVFVRVYTGQLKVKESAAKLALVYMCTGCGTYTLQRIATNIPTRGDNFKCTPAIGPQVEARCEHCGGRHQMGGPVWAERLHDSDFVNNVMDLVGTELTHLKTADRILGMLSMVQEELPDEPLFYVTDALCSKLHCTPPPLLTIRSAILHAGYEVSLSHCAKNSIKTNAPVTVIWDVLRCWVSEHPVKEGRLQEGSVAKSILSKPPTLQANFELHPDANPNSRKKGLLRWQKNPEPEWGPKVKATRGTTKQTQMEKRQRMQGSKHKQPTEEQLEQEAEMKKQFPCKRFKKGKCDKGSDCCYSHDISKHKA